MNIQFRERPDRAAVVAAKTAIADCDIHPARATPTELYPYLAKRWHGHLETIGPHAYQGMMGGPPHRDHDSDMPSDMGPGDRPHG